MTTTEVRVRRVCARDETAFLERIAASRTLHHPWVEPPSTPAQFHNYIERIRVGRTHGFLVEHAASGELAGVINLNDVIAGRFRSANLGYYALAPYAGSGCMAPALRRIVAIAFEELGLHRLEANIQPDNIPSLRLVQRCGFAREGFSPRFLYINGAWRDHERWAIVDARSELLPNLPAAGSPRNTLP